jgi:hypothetical protein
VRLESETEGDDGLEHAEFRVSGDGERYERGKIKARRREEFRRALKVSKV